MMLKDLILQKKKAVLERWFQLVLETYPIDSVRFLKHEKNRFANPVGNTIFQEIGNIFEELLHGMDSADISIFLDRVVRIRAVQDFSPSRALQFIFDLKNVIREELGDELRNHSILTEYLKFESRIDKLAMLSFDIYMKCREQIYESRVNEVKNKVSGLLKRSDLIYEISEEAPDLQR